MKQDERDFVVVGAGVAGLAATAWLRRAGLDCVVIEAGHRIGGRGWTACPPELGGAPFDHGAVWLHAAERNPVAALARAAGETLIDADAVRVEHTRIGGRLADSQETTAYDRAWRRFEAEAEALTRTGLPDAPLSAVTARMSDDPWALTVEAWQGAVIATADAERLSLRDWQDNLLSGANLITKFGLGALVGRLMAPPPEAIRLGCPVRRVRWGQSGGVAVETAQGTLHARACIVTVSTGVLASGAIAFEPELPDDVRGCIEALPMGLAIKVALRAAGEDRLELPPYSLVDRQVRDRSDPMMVFDCWPFGRDHVIGWIGGEAAWELARAGQGAAEDFARTQLRHLFGARADRVFAAGAVTTGWASDPCFLGAYAYARPGAADARERLGMPLAGGRLAFAGEACHRGLAGTVGGAFLSGEAVARTIAEALLKPAA